MFMRINLAQFNNVGGFQYAVKNYG